MYYYFLLQSLTSKNKLNEKEREELEDFTHLISMHIVAMSPKFLRRNIIPSEVLKGEQQIMKEQIINSSGEKKINEKNIEKILNAKMNKWYEENVLEEQTYVIVDYDEDNSKPLRIDELVKSKAKSMNKELSLVEFKLYV